MKCAFAWDFLIEIFAILGWIANKNLPRVGDGPLPVEAVLFLFAFSALFYYHRRRLERLKNKRDDPRTEDYRRS